MNIVLASVLVDGFGSLQLCLGDFVSWSVPLAAAPLMVFLGFSLAYERNRDRFPNEENG
jgi:hypothetical protein